MRTDGNIRSSCIIGYPVEHSLSPKLHGFWIKKYGITAKYTALSVAPHELEITLKSLKKLGYVGCNVTLPYKEEVMNLMEECSDLSRLVGSVNTVVVKEDGSLYGDNTDVYGFTENLCERVPDLKSNLRNVSVLGAGGAARAVCVGLIQLGAKQILIFNRNRERSEELAKDFGPVIKPQPWDRRSEMLGGISLLINATSLGMKNQPPLDIDLSLLPNSAIVNDLVYSPLMTNLLIDAKVRGNTIVDGLGMLLHQARSGFTAWFGVEVEVTYDLRKFILESLVVQS